MIERIYAPLFDELTQGRKKLFDLLQRTGRTEWERINRSHLTHWLPNGLGELLTEIYSDLDGRLVESARVAETKVSSVLDNYLQTRWKGPQEITVPVDTWISETRPFCLSDQYRNLVSGKLFRSIALNEPTPNDTELEEAFNYVKPLTSLTCTSIRELVQDIRKIMMGDSVLEEFNSAFNECRTKTEKALKLLTKELKP